MAVLDSVELKNRNELIANLHSIHSKPMNGPIGLSLVVVKPTLGLPLVLDSSQMKSNQ